MPTALTIRRLNAEARQQHRLKARLAAWWHAERCAHCSANRAAISIPAGIADLLSIIAADRQDDTPTKAH